jgi:hypothetical protein
MAESMCEGTSWDIVTQFEQRGRDRTFNDEKEEIVWTDLRHREFSDVPTHHGVT